MNGELETKTQLVKVTSELHVHDVHTNLQYSPAGLHVNVAFPHLGAFPDGNVTCDCCGEGLIEILCFYNWSMFQLLLNSHMGTQ